MPNLRIPSDLESMTSEILRLSDSQYNISPENVRVLITYVTYYFRSHLKSAGYTDNNIRPLTTKFRDAGRRSAPWKPTSGRVPGRPQDGADGNRRSRWLFPEDHKFYANEVSATLVEVKYCWQTLSMVGAPEILSVSLRDSFTWLTGHATIPGLYLDPIQLVPIDFREFIATPTLVQSGHLVPLDRGGRHIPNNTFLMLARSNQLQGNQTLDELIELMAQIVKRHESRK